MSNQLADFIQECKNDWNTQPKKTVASAINSNVSKYMNGLELLQERYAKLEKQATPTKPHVYTLFITDGPRNHMWNREISENRCGSCDKKIDRDFAFCPYCGQALDWSDEK